MGNEGIRETAEQDVMEVSRKQLRWSCRVQRQKSERCTALDLW